jgi:oxygen-dependent protoporphyrinogen oxidase
MTDASPNVRAPRVVVVGGGIAGLTAAYTIITARPDVEVVVLEGSSRAGGKLWATNFAGHSVDAGADAFLARVPDAVELCRELGLEGELVVPMERRALLLHGGRLHALPEGLVLGIPTDFDALRASGLVGEAAVRLAEADRSNTDAPIEHDETVGSYVRRHVGDEVFETLVSPLLGGINAGDADELSLFAGAPQLAAAACAGGSLVATLSAQVGDRDPDVPVFHSLAGGAGRLAEVLVTRLGDRIRYRKTVEQVRPAEDGGYLVDPETPGSATIEADAVVIAVPAFATSALVRTLAEAVSDELAELEYASVEVVTLRFARADVDAPLDASGYLVAPSEGLVTTACSFGSAKWPHWSDPDHLVLRISAGRHGDERAMAMGHAELADQVVSEATEPLGIQGQPDEVRVTRWPRSLPQYRPGHLDRVDRWEATLGEEAPGVALAGAALRGLGVPACVRSGRFAAGRVLTALDR